jgi:hypothetical protein
MIHDHSAFVSEYKLQGFYILLVLVDHWRLEVSDLPGLAQSHEPGQAGPLVTAQHWLWPGSGRGFSHVIKFM